MILSDTELLVVRYKVLGFTQKAIAERLCRSVLTIHKHLQNVYQKLGVRNENQLHNWYCKNILNVDIEKLLQ